MGLFVEKRSHEFELIVSLIVDKIRWGHAVIWWRMVLQIWTNRFRLGIEDVW